MLFRMVSSLHMHAMSVSFFRFAGSQSARGGLVKLPEHWVPARGHQRTHVQCGTNYGHTAPDRAPASEQILPRTRPRASPWLQRENLGTCVITTARHGITNQRRRQRPASWQQIPQISAPRGPGHPCRPRTGNCPPAGPEDLSAAPAQEFSPFVTDEQNEGACEPNSSPLPWSPLT